MPITPVYNMLSSQIPAVPCPGNMFLTNIDINTWLSFNLYPYEGVTDSNSFVAIETRNAARLKVLSRHGGTVYGVLWGMGLSDGGGQTVNVAYGQATLDGPFPTSVPTIGSPGYGTGYWTVALANNSYNWIWHEPLHANPYYTSGVDPTIPIAGYGVYLGRVHVAGGAIDEIDLSGVITYNQGGIPKCKSGDIGIPAWTPPATVRFLQETKTGLYYWGGTSWWMLTEAFSLNPSTVALGATAVVPVGQQVVLIGETRTLGEMIVHGEVMNIF